MIEEMLNSNELEKMLRDSFANYVVQTALDYAEPDTKTRLVEAIRPILPAIRQTPYGRRIQSKILGGEGQGRLSGISTPNDVTSPGQIPLGRQLVNGPTGVSYVPQQASGFQLTNGIYTDQNQNLYQMNGANGTGQFNTATPAASMFQSHRFSNGSSTFNQYNPSANQNSMQQPVSLYGRAPQANGFNYF